jgi:hypothetical protein
MRLSKPVTRVLSMLAVTCAAAVLLPASPTMAAVASERAEPARCIDCSYDTCRKALPTGDCDYPPNP